MLRQLFSRLRTRLRRRWTTDEESTVEGTGEAICSPQHRRSPAARRELERLEEVAREHDERR